MNKYDRCLVVDSSGTPRAIISSIRAFTIKYKGNAHVVAEHPEAFGLVNKDLVIMKPSIIQVPSYVNGPFIKVPLTRQNVYRRDDFTCVYCNEKSKDLTLDHVHPKSKGGKDSWENLVTACKPCNQEKADLTLDELGREIPEPKRPHYLMLLKKTSYIAEEWKPYLLM